LRKISNRKTVFQGPFGFVVYRNRLEQIGPETRTRQVGKCVLDEECVGVGLARVGDEPGSGESAFGDFVIGRQDIPGEGRRFPVGRNGAADRFSRLRRA